MLHRASLVLLVEVFTAQMPPMENLTKNASISRDLNGRCISKLGLSECDQSGRKLDGLRVQKIRRGGITGRWQFGDMNRR